MSELEVDAQSRGRQLIQQAADAFWAEKYPNNAVTHEYRLGFYVAHQLMEEEGITLDRLNAAIEASSIAEAGRLRYETALKEIAGQPWPSDAIMGIAREALNPLSISGTVQS